MISRMAPLPRKSAVICVSALRTWVIPISTYKACLPLSVLHGGISEASPEFMMSNDREPLAHPLLRPRHDVTDRVSNHSPSYEPSESVDAAEKEQKMGEKCQLQPKQCLHVFAKPIQYLGLWITTCWQRIASFCTSLWSTRWTAEACSYVISLLAFGGLFTTLMAHQARPLPQWPQLVTINSIVSLFSLLIRASVGLILAEGKLSSLMVLHISNLDADNRHRYQPIQVAMVSQS